MGKDISGAVIYTIADKLKLKAFKRQKYQCVNLAGRAFTAYLDDIPAKMLWADGRTAEVYKEDKLYAELNEITTPGVEYITALVIKTNDAFCFYGNGIQVADATYEFERLRREQEAFLDGKKQKKIGSSEKKALPLFSSFHLPGKTVEKKESDFSEQSDSQQDQ